MQRAESREREIKASKQATHRVARLALSVLLRGRAKDTRPAGIVVRAEHEARAVHAAAAATAAGGAAPDVAVGTSSENQVNKGIERLAEISRRKFQMENSCSRKGLSSNRKTTRSYVMYIHA